MLGTVENTIKRTRLLLPGDKIVVAVSGGPDSTALLLILWQLAPRYHWRLRAAHVNYCSRGQDSERDEAFVCRLAARLKVPLTVTRQPLDPAMGSFEAHAREIRYKFFETVRRKCRADRIAVAQTSDDLVETMLLNFLRGCGLRGAAGMPIQRGRIVRPLYQVDRAAIRRWLKKQHQPWRVDRSNRDLKYMRNWIRWKLLPSLRCQAPDFDRRMRQASQFFDRAATWLEKEACRQLYLLTVSIRAGGSGYRLKPFLQLPLILQGEMIRHLLGKTDIARQHVAEVLRMLKYSESGKKKVFKKRSVVKQKTYFECRSVLNQ